MLRLLKLLAYALLGYALYEFVRGMSNAEGGMSMGGQGAQGGGRSLGAGGGMSRAQNISGPGTGMRVETNEADGGVSTQKVGRGVIS